MRARQGDFFVGPLMAGYSIYPYQLALGFSLRYWPCLYAPSVRIHFGPLKVWFGFSFKPRRRNEVSYAKHEDIRGGNEHA